MGPVHPEPGGGTGAAGRRPAAQRGAVRRPDGASATVLPREDMVFFDVDTAAASRCWPGEARTTRSARGRSTSSSSSASGGPGPRWTSRWRPGTGSPTSSSRRGRSSRAAAINSSPSSPTDWTACSPPPMRRATGANGFRPTFRVLELWLQLLRIGARRHRGRFLRALEQHVVGNTLYAETQARRCFLLLVRWARENDETQFLGRILSGRTRPGSGNQRPGRWCMYFGAAEALGPGAIDLDGPRRTLPTARPWTSAGRSTSGGGPVLTGPASSQVLTA